MSIREAEYPARGWEVHPGFLGPFGLDKALFERMEQHPLIPGKSSWGTRNMLHALILSTRPRLVLEIGAHIGSGSVVMGAALKANRYGKLIALEPQKQYFSVLTEMVREAGLNDYVQPLKMFSTDPALATHIDDRIDLIYLDANHSYSHALTDIRLSDQWLAPNGLLLLDDVGPEMSPKLCSEGKGGVRRALLDFVANRPDLKTIFLEPPFWLNPCGLAIVCKQQIA